MALWAETQLLPSEKLQQIQAIYGYQFPVEVRHYLAQFIEENFGNDAEVDSENPEHEQDVKTLVDLLIYAIENKAVDTTDDDFWTKLKLFEAAKMFKQQHSSNPMRLFNYIRRCLTFEIKLVQDPNNETDSSGNLPLSSSRADILPQIPVEVKLHQDPNNGKNSFGNLLLSCSRADILPQIHELTRRTQETSDALLRLQRKQEDFELIYHQYTEAIAYLKQLHAHSESDPQISTINKIFNNNCIELIQLKSALCEKLRTTFQLLVPLQKHILEEELSKWQKEQLEGNVANDSINLDTIQEWCENLAEIIWVNREQIKKINAMKEHPKLESPVDNLSVLLDDITQLLSKLVTSTFIVESQPPQIMKTNNKQTATVRLLVGNKLNIHMISPQVKVSINSATQASHLVINGNLNAGEDKSGEVLNNTGTMEYQEATRQLLLADFRNLKLEKIQRGGKKGTESVIDDTLCLCGELVVQDPSLSLPVVVVVHGSQESHAWATIIWDNTFCEPGRSPFAVPEQVAWTKVAEVLSSKFKSVTKRSLTEENLRFLSEKAFRGDYNQDSNNMLSWPQFATDLLPGRNFTFWEWFYAVMMLTKEHLLGPWLDGCIMGFVKKQEAEQMLSAMPTGTFLLRFSDSEKGGLTIAWVSETKEVFSLQPFTAKDFAVRSLADRISDLKYIMYLYRDIPKELAFGKYCTAPLENPGKAGNNWYGDGYVKCSIINVEDIENHTNPLTDTPSCVGENTVDFSLTNVNDLMEGCVL